MKYRDFGKTGIKVSEVGFGTRALGGGEHGAAYGFTDDKISLEALSRAIDLGCNFFDTADVYGRGHAEELLGRALKNKRDRLIIATKAGSDFYQGPGFQTFTPEYIRFALEKSLDRLRTDYIDVYLMHNPPMRLINRDDSYETFRELKKEGKIRSWGVSVFDAIEAETALSVGKPDCLEIAYSLFSTRAKDSLFPRAFDEGCAIIAREPLANGFLTGKYTSDCKFGEGDIRAEWPPDYVSARALAAARLSFLTAGGARTQSQAAIRFVLEEKAVTVVIPGIKTPEQAEENMYSCDVQPFTKGELATVYDLIQNNFSL